MMKGFLVLLLATTAMAASAQTPKPVAKSAESKASPAQSESKGAATKKKTSKPRTTAAESKKKAVPPEEKASEANANTPESKTGKSDLLEGPPAPGAKEKTNYGKPALIETAQLLEFDTLPEDRKKLIEGAVATARDSPWLPYLFGGSDPKDGGFDCSGAMYYVMRKAGLEPPRTSAGQYLWLQDSNGLIKVSPDTRDFNHPSLKLLKPGDLLFWGGTYAPTDGRQVNITHVALYLGHEKKDKRPVMINATDGRSYRGTKANGYGVYDFQLPKEGTKAVFMGYGTPPGIKE